MFWEALGSVLLGLALAWSAARTSPARLPARQVVLVTGPIGALFGAFLTHSALGPGHLLATLVGAVAVSAVVLSLLVRPAGRIRRSATI
ncbi:hypothetical protein OG709_24125 [Streptomyces sp. NBC_01267]|uniref:hypothetical protein n=1 Tax=unclassified Streptomyces TaxID=2593676 RepID=UPI002024FBFF|nr:MULTISPECIES: hypothetical protein [unclassified Streptomyces]MCX4548395.1 hypothetical protein [Streptomyces sp. NBC_01500]WSV54038.1 hypothetical protein OG282_10130 [Streptomyces sp. NBC_01014]